MSEDTIYTLDLERTYRLHDVYRHYFPLPEVTLYHAPEWNATLQQWVVSVRSPATDALGIYIPCNYLAPDPTPRFRITETIEGRTQSFDVQGIPVGAHNLAEELTRPDFTWLGIQRGTLRLSIERL